VRAEADALFDGPGAVSVADFDYTSRCFQEAMRLYPSIHHLMRQATEDTTLGRWRIPKGSLVDVPVYLLQRDPRHFPDPDRFDPDRFLPENAKGRPVLAHAPFGGGPHLCPGRHLASAIAVPFIAQAARRF